MESRDLRIFEVVASEKSISKAALKMGYVQSNVTARIKILEEELGTTLMVRHNKGVTLTSSGEKLLVYAHKIIGLINEAENAFKYNNSIKIGATETIAASVVPRFLSKYSETYPGVTISLKTASAKNLVEQVIKGELDGAFTNVKCLHNDIDSLVSFSEEVVIISSQDVANIEKLLEKPLIINSNRECPYRKLLENWVLENKETPARSIEVDSLEGIKKCVENGMGISLLPKNLIKDSDKLLTYELSKEISSLEVYFIKRKNSDKNKLIDDLILLFFI